MDQNIVQPLRDSLGSGIIDFEMNSTELSSLVNTLNDFANSVQGDESYETSMRTYIDN